MRLSNIEIENYLRYFNNENSMITHLSSEESKIWIGPACGHWSKKELPETASEKSGSVQSLLANEKGTYVTGLRIQGFKVSNSQSISRICLRIHC